MVGRAVRVLVRLRPLWDGRKRGGRDGELEEFIVGGLDDCRGTLSYGDCGV